jgi:hypothetical protein
MDLKMGEFDSMINNEEKDDETWSIPKWRRIHTHSDQRRKESDPIQENSLGELDLSFNKNH